MTVNMTNAINAEQGVAERCWDFLDRVQQKLSRLDTNIHCLGRYAGSAMAAPLVDDIEQARDQLGEAMYVYQQVCEQHKAALEQLRADKDHHIEHLVSTHSRRTVMLAAVTQALREAADDANRKAAKAGRPTPEWVTNAVEKLTEAKKLLES